MIFWYCLFGTVDSQQRWSGFHLFDWRQSLCSVTVRVFSNQTLPHTLWVWFDLLRKLDLQGFAHILKCELNWFWKQAFFCGWINTFLPRRLLQLPLVDQNHFYLLDNILTWHIHLQQPDPKKGKAGLKRLFLSFHTKPTSDAFCTVKRTEQISSY